VGLVASETPVVARRKERWWKVKRIGECKCGCVIVAANKAELLALGQFASELGTLVGLDTAPAAVDAVAPARPKKSGKDPVEPKQTGNKCVICGKPCKRSTCSDACRKQKDRNYANAWYAKNKSLKSETKAKVAVVASVSSGEKKVLSPVDSHAAIRAALARADAKLAGGK